MSEQLHGRMYKAFESMTVPELKLTLRKFWSMIATLENNVELLYNRYGDLLNRVTEDSLEADGRCLFCNSYLDDAGHSSVCPVVRYRSWRTDGIGQFDRAMIHLYELKKDILPSYTIKDSKINDYSDID